MKPAPASVAPPTFVPRERLVLWVLWFTYGSFYFCRNNLGLAVPGIGAEFHLDKADLGKVLGALKLAYGIGQFVNGQLAERFSPRRLLAVGLLASAALNVMFGFATALYFMIFIWACNGYVQALGWPPTMRIAANWFPKTQRGRAIGIIGTGYQLCGALTFVVAGWAAARFGWRAALFVPSAILVVSAVHMWFFLEEHPRTEQLLADQIVSAAPTHGSFGKNIMTTLGNPALWMVGGSLALLDACRYGFTDWGVSHLKEIQGDSVDTAAFKYAVLPFGGMIGGYLSGWATDRFFGGRRVPVITALLLALGMLALVYDTVLRWGLGYSVVILFLIGFCIFGPQVLLVGTLPIDVARRGTAAAAAGFVNFMGYLGAAAGDQLTGILAQKHGWPAAVRFWAFCALASALVIVCLWKAEFQRTKARKGSAD